MCAAYAERFPGEKYDPERREPALVSSEKTGAATGAAEIPAVVSEAGDESDGMEEVPLALHPRASQLPALRNLCEEKLNTALGMSAKQNDGKSEDM